MRIIIMAATILIAGFQFAAASTNYVETPQGVYSYHDSGMGNAMNQGG